MLKLIKLFVLFLVCDQGRVRVSRWQELRAACLERAYEGVKKPKAIEAV